MAEKKKVKQRSVDPEREWAAWDIETWSSPDPKLNRWNELRVAVVYDGVRKWPAWSAEELVKLMHDLAKGLNGKRVYWAHFGGRFDNLFILSELLKRYELKFYVVGSSLVKVKAYACGSKLFELRDSFNILPASLAQLARSFAVTLKDTAVDRRNITALSDEEVVEYCATDCVALREVLIAARAKFGVQDFKLTIASQARTDWAKVAGEEQYRCVAELDEYFRKAYYGGRVEVFTRKGENLNYYDVNSMYPWAMSAHDFPYGATHRTRVREQGQLGVYTVEVTCPPMAIPLLPHRRDGKLVFPTGKWVGTYASPELDEAERLGYSFRVVSGVAWRGAAKPFGAYVAKWHKVKQEAAASGDEALKFIAKLHLNTLYGKLGQRREHRVLTTELTAGCEDFLPLLGIYSRQEESRLPFTHAHLAVFVTAYARVHLHRLLTAAAATGEVYYCDTDSLVTSATLKTGAALGELKLEHRVRKGVFLLPKVYALRDEDGRDTMRAKGFSAEALTWGLYDAALRADWKKFTSEREGLMGLFECAARNKALLTRRVLKRVLRGTFDKRTIQRDGLTTRPLVIEEVEQWKTS